MRDTKWKGAKSVKISISVRLVFIFFLYLRAALKYHVFIDALHRCAHAVLATRKVVIKNGSSDVKKRHEKKRNDNYLSYNIVSRKNSINKISMLSKTASWYEIFHTHTLAFQKVGHIWLYVRQNFNENRVVLTTLFRTQMSHKDNNEQKKNIQKKRLYYKTRMCDCDGAGMRVLFLSLKRRYLNGIITDSPVD